MKIILADSHGMVMGKDQTSANLSLLYLGAYLKSKIPEVHLTYIPQAKSERYHLELIEILKPDFYAVSFTSFSAEGTFMLIQKIKKKYPSLIIVCGGPHVFTHAKQTLEKSGADIAVLGEGEVTFYEIVKNKKILNDVIENINGIAFFKNGKYYQTLARALINNIDDIPFPLRDLVNDADFCGLTYSKARPNTEMIITRGCPMRCVFCANPVFRVENGPLFRSRSPQNITEEIKELYKRGYREIYMHSDELNVNLNWAIETCKAIANLNYKDLFFQCNLRVEPMSAELAYWMNQANFWMVRVGVETTSDRVLKGIKKYTSFQKTLTSLKLLRHQGIKVFAFAMLFNFWEEDGKLKHETAEEVRKTIKDFYSLWKKGLLNYTSWAFACPVQGAELYEIALRHKLIDENYYPSDKWNSYEHLKHVSKKEFNSLYAKARRQQAIMALTSGNFEIRNYKGILRKAITMLKGKPS